MHESNFSKECRVAFVTIVMIVLSSVSNANEIRSFDIKKGPASQTLKRFARQSGMSMVFDSREIRDVQTVDVVGLMIPSDALSRMLVNSNLVFNKDDETGAFAVTRIAGLVETTKSSHGTNEVFGANQINQPESIKRMNNKKSPLARFTRGFAALAVAGSSVGLAQENNSDDVFELSPFVVDATTDEGYRATNTLSGNRLNTENRYVGASVTEITSQLLEDVGINNFEDVLDLVPNSSKAESGGLSADPTGNEAIFGVRYRVRGFLLTGFSRDFFKTRVAPDSYNTDRMSFSRGPNSVLFGIAEPGGVTNAVSSRAAFANTNEVGLRFDTWDSARYSFSLNRELVEDKLALKVAAVYDDHRNHRNPWHNQSERYYGAITYKPFENTTIRASYEKGDAERINARSWAPTDAISIWEAAGSQSIPDAYVNPSASIPVAERQAFGLRQIQAAPRYAYTTGSTVSDLVYQPRWELQTEQNNVPGFVVNTNGGISFTDDSIIPLTANVLGGGNKLVQDFSNATVVLEQKLAEGLFMELAYNRQDTDNQPDFSTGANDYVYKDLLPTVRKVNPNDPTNTDGEIIPNPNFGRYYAYNHTPVTFDQTYDDETLRAMVSYEFDFRDKRSDRLGSILGRHNIAAMYEEYKETFVNRNYHFRNAIRETGQVRYDAPTAWINLQNYLDIENGNFAPDNIAQMYPRIWNENVDEIPAPDGTGVTPIWLGINGTNTESKTESKMLALQNFFWDSKIVTTFGWRSDDVESYSLRRTLAPGTRLRSNVALYDPKAESSPVSAGGDTTSRGVVVTPISWLGFFYNESNNFRPANADQLNIFGESLGNESGEGKDYGLKFHLMEGKLTGSLAIFETSFKNQSTRGPRVGPVGRFDPARTAAKTAIQDYFTDIGQPDRGLVYEDHGYFNTDYFATQDFASEGWEFSLTGNPTDNWRITVNVSKQENVSSNVAPAMKEWAKSIRTLVDDPTLLALETNTLKADGVTYNTVADNFDLNDQRIVEITSLEGFADQRQPEMSANIVTAYSFPEGRFKGLSLGGQFRWRDQAAVGYELNDDGSGALDSAKPYYNESTEWFGFFASYNMMVFSDVKMRIQLNIDNVFDDDDGNVLLSREVAGSRFDSRWSLPEGRSFALSTNFEF